MDLGPPALIALHPQARRSSFLHLVIAERDPISRQGLRSIFSPMPDAHCTVAADRTELAHAIIASPVDVLVLLSSVDVDGKLVRESLAQRPDLGVLVIVERTSRQRWYLEMQHAAGVRGLIADDSPFVVFHQAVEHIGRQGEFLDPRLQPLLHRRGRSGHGLLTARQREVLVLVAEGCTNAEIATALFVSIETVRTHVRHILHRLSAHDRVHAVTRAFRLRILSASPPGSALWGSNNDRSPFAATGSVSGRTNPLRGGGDAIDQAESLP
ncbi:response regulator transcription factor [Amycolatopsis sp. NPDC004378]